MIKTFLTNKSISSYFNKSKKVILLENLDVLINTDRNILAMLDDVYPFLEKTKCFMIVTCKSNEEKKLVEMKTQVEPIKINYPSVKDSFAYLSVINDTHDLGVDDDRLLSLVNKYKGSIRDIILNIYLQDEEYDDIASFKDMTQFEIVKKICRKAHSLNEIEHLIKDDLGMVPYLLYENVIDEMHTNMDNRTAKKMSLIDANCKINELYVDSCIIEDYMYKSAEWQMYDLVQLLKLQGVNLIMQDLKKKKTVKDVKYRYSQMISKISHRNIMNKKIKNIQRKNGDIDIVELTYLIDKIKISSKKSKYDMEESNFINTYQKNFE